MKRKDSFKLVSWIMDWYQEKVLPETNLEVKVCCCGCNDVITTITTPHGMKVLLFSNIGPKKEVRQILRRFHKIAFSGPRLDQGPPIEFKLSDPGKAEPSPN